jgi:carbamoyl-phosphate synthase small subunit
LPQYLRDEGTVAIAGIDTRRLTRVLRSTGAQNGCIVAFRSRPRGSATPRTFAEAVATGPGRRPRWRAWTWLAR